MLNAPPGFLDKFTAEQIAQMSADRIFWQAFDAAAEDRISGEWVDARPYLAHYTSIETLEKILQTNEIWMSNPLFMNDLEELRYGMFLGKDRLNANKRLREACGSQARWDRLQFLFDEQFVFFDRHHSLDTYVFCLSEVPQDEVDGALSMWRGYGMQGKGVALVFDTTKLEVGDAFAPLLIRRVRYKSALERRDAIDQTLNAFADALLKISLPDEKLHIPAFIIFNAVKDFALTYKHKGFAEEREWRIIFTKARDLMGQFNSYLDYRIGRSGVEPKLKLCLPPHATPLPGAPNLDELVHRLILGPSLSSELAKNSVARMLQRLNHEILAPKLAASSIPYRSFG